MTNSRESVWVVTIEAALHQRKRPTILFLGFYDSVELLLFFHPVVTKLGGEAGHHGAFRYRR